MTDGTNIAKIKFSDCEGKTADVQLQFNNSSLIISDEQIRPLASKCGIKAIKTCSITLGANNIAFCVQDYTLTDTIYIDNFYNMPSYISIMQINDVKVHIVKQRIGLLQADCPSILLGECQIDQFDIGLSKHSKSLIEKPESKDDEMPTVYHMSNIDIRSCKVNVTKSYVSCDSINIQESSIGTFNMYRGCGSKVIAEIKRLYIWLHTTIDVSEIHCTVSNFTLSESSIRSIAAKACCEIVELVIRDAIISDAHCFEKNHFVSLDLNAWFLIGRSAENSLDVSLKNEAFYHISKLKHKQDKGLKRLFSGWFGICSGYGYKPMRAMGCCLIVALISAIAMTVYNMLRTGCAAIQSFGNSIILSFASLAGQSGLKIENGFPFWIACTEYVCSVVLFAVFVNALYVRYKD